MANHKWIIIVAVIVGVTLLALPVFLNKKETYQIEGPGGKITVTVDKSLLKKEVPKEMVLIPFGQKGQLATIWIQILSSSEEQVLKSNNQFVKDAYASTGTKFVVITASICNTTKEPISTRSGFNLQDGTGRQYNAYKKHFMMEGYSPLYSLQPSIPNTCKFIFEVPFDSTDYGLVSGKSGTNEVYKFLVK